MNMLRLKILIVDDHELTRLAFKTILKKVDYFDIVGQVENGYEAVSFCESNRVDIVLMDVSMPVMDGITATQKISQINKDIKIIMLTQHDNDQDIMASLASGACGYCLKDVEIERLKLAITSVYNGDLWLDSRIAKKILDNCLSPTRKIASDSNSFVQYESLTPREIDVLKLIVEGLSNSDIGQKLFISLTTVKSHVRNILAKLSCHDRTQAAIIAMRNKLV